MSPAEIVSMLLDRHAFLLAQEGRAPMYLEYKQLRLWCDENRMSDSELTQTMAIDVAQRYNRREIAYWPADWIMNSLFFALTSEPLSNFSELFLDVYEAFDAGEYWRDKDHGAERAEPSEKYTRPAIIRILSHVDQLNSMK